MYQALYRKYRPKNLDDVVGQLVVKQTLKNAIKNDQISHAYLFTGPRGTGKTSIAKILAKTVNCTNITNGLPCDKCDSCLQINNKQNTDIIEIDAASNNGVDEIRELRNKVSLVPSFSKYKVYIIDEVHMLTQGAFNALLKTLEEPPEHIIFVLATTEPHKIPATILSRCQRFDFKKISKTDIADRLKNICDQENIEINNDALLEISRLSDGGMRDSISMLDQVNAYANGKITVNDVHEVNGTITKIEIKELIKLFINKETKELLNKFEEYDGQGKNLIKLVEEIIFYLKNLLIYSQTKEIFDDTVNVEDYEEILKISNNRVIIDLIKNLNNNLSDMKKTLNPKISLELLILSNLNEEKVFPKTENNNEKVEKVVEKKEENEQLNHLGNTSGNNKKNINNQIKINKKIENIDKVKEVRINNTLSKLNKANIKKLKNKLEDLRIYSLNEKYCEIISYILDSQIKATSDDSVIFVFENKNISEIFNDKILEIEQLLSEKINLKIKVISTDKDDWEIIKNTFNSKKKQYIYMEEPELKIKEENKKNNIENLFEEIIEYK